MKYFKVNQQVRRIAKDKNGYPYFETDWIKNELYTEREMQKLKETHFIPEGIFEQVEISKRKTYWFFGCRFAAE